MNTTKLEQANAIKKQITDLQYHKDAVFPKNVKKPYLDMHTNESKPKLEAICRSHNRNESRELLHDLLPLDIETFMHIYEMKLDKKIADLEREFDNL